MANNGWNPVNSGWNAPNQSTNNGWNPVNSGWNAPAVDTRREEYERNRNAQIEAERLARSIQQNPGATLGNTETLIKIKEERARYSIFANILKSLMGLNDGLSETANNYGLEDETKGNRK